MEGRRVFAAEARELDRAERGAIVCAREEGRKRLGGKKRRRKRVTADKKEPGKRKKRRRGGVEKEEAKQERGEREMTGGVEGWRET